MNFIFFDYIMQQNFNLHLDILPWDRPAAEHYGEIRVALEAQDNTIGNMDMLIAAHARSQGMILVINNEKHFQQVPDLDIENWTKSNKIGSVPIRYNA